MAKKESKLGYLWAGIVGGFAAVTCCIAPMVLIILGFGAAVGMSVMHKFHTVSIVSGVVFMLLLSLYLVKRQAGVCNINSMKQNWKPLVSALVIMVVSLYAVNYLVVAPIANVVYGNLEVDQKPLGTLEAMAESHGMPEMANLEIVPEEKGTKRLTLEIEGLFCGSCGPAIEYDVKSVAGVENVEMDGSQMIVTYDSDVTSKHIVLASVHDPYTATIVDEQCSIADVDLEEKKFEAC